MAGQGEHGEFGLGMCMVEEGRKVKEVVGALEWEKEMLQGKQNGNVGGREAVFMRGSGNTIGLL